MGASKYIYTVYDAKTGEYVAKGTAAQLAGKRKFAVGPPTSWI